MDEIYLRKNISFILEEMIATTTIDIIEGEYLFCSMELENAFWKIMHMFTAYHTEKNRKNNV